VIFGTLATLGRLLGYRAEYPYPYEREGEASSIGGEATTAWCGGR
jgi:hypothetical protein